MKMTPQIATMRIQRELVALEATLAEGLERAATLTATMARARADANASPAMAHDLFLRLTSVQSGLLKANADTARVHEGLSKIGRELGLVDEPSWWHAESTQDREAA